MAADELERRPYLYIPTRLNIAEAVVDRHVAAGRGARIAAWTGDRAYSYAELRELSNRFGNVLRGLGVRAGERVMLRLGTNIYSMIAILGAFKIGAVVIPSNFLFRDHEIAKILNNSEASVVVSTEELAPAIEAARAGAPFLKHVIIADSHGELSWPRLMERASSELTPEPTRADQLAFIIYTSGTTGDPKGVEQAHRWILGAGDPVNRVMVRLSADDVCYQPQDWSFIYPLGSGFFFPLLFGASTVIHEGRFDPEAALHTIKRRGATVMYAVPTIYRMIAAVDDAEARSKLRTLKMGVSAGEALPEDTFRDWQERLGVTLHDGIGQTECHIFIGNQLGARIKPGSMGKPLPGYDVNVLDDSGAPCAPGEPGHLVFRNDHPGLALGYRNDPERWAAVNRGGWYYTKDICHVDDEGYYWYLSRSDDLIKSRAYLISPREVEAVLMEHPAVLEAAVVGLDAEHGEHRVKAFLTLKPGHQAHESLTVEIKAHVRGAIAPYKVPQEIEFVADLPKTTTGKILRRELRARG
ncbi:MAG: acyl-CoA synthetase [Candidatus Binataceae bacterium]